jgi:hypothetical protein
MLLVLVLVGAAYVAQADDAECLEVGSSVGPFYVADVTGPAAGEKLCYRCLYGDKPVVSIFAREVNDELGALIQQIDETVGANGEKGMAAFVVLLTDDPAGQEEALRELKEEYSIEHTPLTTFDGTAGPETYKIQADADVTVMMWVDHTLTVNSTLESGSIDEEAVAGVVEQTSTILEAEEGT